MIVCPKKKNNIYLKEGSSLAKKRNIIDILIKWINSLFAVLLLLAYAVPYFEPKNADWLSVLSIFTPMLILVNLAFVVYWLIRLKKELLISLLVLLVGFKSLGRFYNYNKAEVQASNLSVMSYNVRAFNIYDWIKQKDVPQKINAFINNENPDIICFQEYYEDKNMDFSAYNYHYKKGSSKTGLFGQAIFSKYKIINSGSLDFKETANNAIFVDVLKGKDTLRVYNIHLQSLKVYKLAKNVAENKERLLKRIAEANEKQQEQVQQILKHKEKVKHKTLFCGDFNNTAFSYSYSQLNQGMQDAFVTNGNGFGATFSNYYFPYRIDFILVDEHLKISDFQTFDVDFSDHKPIVAKLVLD
jgi:endonuclease/exonuclease/phosphatase family metal-dependent hydrolase